MSAQPIHWLSQTLRADEAEVARVMQICNACRYCEGYCAVFPAMTRRIDFDHKADVHYLANLCHNCGACLHSCQYAPPHEFQINVPQAMAKVRVQTYADFAWPAPLGALYRANGLAVSLVLALSLSLFLVWTLQSSTGWVHAPLQGNFYAVFPHHTLAWMFGGVFAFAMLALGVGVVRFWRQIRPGPALPGAKAEAITHALTLKYLDGGHGEGCNDEDDAFTLRRRRFHHLTFYGFILCFASTSVATLYHYVFGWSAPYALNSLPVVLGTLGGVGLLVGPLGLWRLNVKRAPGHGDPTQRPMDLGFIALLALTSLSGLALLILRDSAVMALLLAVHLGIVMALFATLPYGKFAHGVYRSASLLKAAIERRMPNTLNLGSD